MSSADAGEDFWANLVTEQDFLDPDADDAWAHEQEEFVDEGDDSSACGVTNLQADGSFGLSFARITTEEADNDPPDDAAFDAEEVSFRIKICKSHHPTNHVICKCC